MTYLHLSKQQLEDITEALEDSSLQAQQRNKLLALRMHHEGAAHGFIGRILNITQPTLRAYLAVYQEGGLPAVLEDRSYRPLSSLAPFWNCLRCSFAAAPVPNAKARRRTHRSAHRPAFEREPVPPRDEANGHEPEKNRAAARQG